MSQREGRERTYRFERGCEAKQLVDVMNLKSALLAAGFDSRKDVELAEHLSLWQSKCLSYW